MDCYGQSCEGFLSTNIEDLYLYLRTRNTNLANVPLYFGLFAEIVFVYLTAYVN